MLIYLALAQILKVEPKETIKYLVVPLGTRVKPGDLLAVKKNFLGKTAAVKAETDGILESLSPLTGELALRVTEAKEEKPERVELKKELKSTPAPAANQLKGFYGFGERREGELIFYPACLAFTEIRKDWEGKVVFAPALESFSSVFKASALGVKALVILSLPAATLAELKKEVAGRTGITFLVLSKNQDKKVIDRIKKLTGKQVVVDTTKQAVLF